MIITIPIWVLWLVGGFCVGVFLIFAVLGICFAIVFSGQLR